MTQNKPKLNKESMKKRKRKTKHSSLNCGYPSLTATWCFRCWLRNKTSAEQGVLEEIRNYIKPAGVIPTCCMNNPQLDQIVKWHNKLCQPPNKN
jgi:hypothetical protein